MVASRNVGCFLRLPQSSLLFVSYGTNVVNDGKEKMQGIELIVSSIFVTIIPSASHRRAILLKDNLLGSVTFFWLIVASRPASTSLQHAFYSLQSANFSSINCKCHI